MTCINCTHDHTEKYCPNCGEHAHVQRITFSSMIGAALFTVTNMDKGFLYNMKSLAISPKTLVTDYIKGKRKGVYNPISFLIIAVTIYLLLDALIDNPASLDTKTPKGKAYAIGTKAGEFMIYYFKYIWILSIFLLGIATRLLFKKYNFSEHLAISSFVIGQATLAALLGLVVFNWTLIFNPIVYLVIGVLIYQIFKTGKDKLLDFFFPIFCVLLFFVQLFVLMLFIGWLRM